MALPEGHWHYQPYILTLGRRVIEDVIMKLSETEAFAKYYVARFREAEFLLRSEHQFFVRFWLAEAQTWAHYWRASTYTDYPYKRPADMTEDNLRTWRAMKNAQAREESMKTHRGQGHRDKAPKAKNDDKSNSKRGSTKAPVPEQPPTRIQVAKYLNNKAPTSEPPASVTSPIATRLSDEAELEAQIEREVKEAAERAFSRRTMMKKEKCEEAGKKKDGEKK